MKNDSLFAGKYGNSKLWHNQRDGNKNLNFAGQARAHCEAASNGKGTTKWLTDSFDFSSSSPFQSFLLLHIFAKSFEKLFSIIHLALLKCFAAACIVSGLVVEFFFLRCSIFEIWFKAALECLSAALSGKKSPLLVNIQEVKNGSTWRKFHSFNSHTTTHSSASIHSSILFHSHTERPDKTRKGEFFRKCRKCGWIEKGKRKKGFSQQRGWWRRSAKENPQKISARN